MLKGKLSEYKDIVSNWFLIIVRMIFLLKSRWFLKFYFVTTSAVENTKKGKKKIL